MHIVEVDWVRMNVTKPEWLSAKIKPQPLTDYTFVQYTIIMIYLTGF